jgi:general secretion pathway protein G
MMVSNRTLSVLHAGPARLRQSGFTLIEIMVVVVILGILAAIVAPNVISRIDDASINRAKQDIRGIESALKLYYMDNSRYPTTDQGLEALTTRPNDPTLRNWRGPYLDKLPRDPWNNTYRYLYPGRNSEFDVFTYGADGQPGGEGINAEIGNWSVY